MRVLQYLPAFRLNGNIIDMPGIHDTFARRVKNFTEEKKMPMHSIATRYGKSEDIRLFHVQLQKYDVWQNVCIRAGRAMLIDVVIISCRKRYEKLYCPTRNRFDYYEF